MKRMNKNLAVVIAVVMALVTPLIGYDFIDSGFNVNATAAETMVWSKYAAEICNESFADNYTIDGSSLISSPDKDAWKWLINAEGIQLEKGYYRLELDAALTGVNDSGTYNQDKQVFYLNIDGTAHSVKRGRFNSSETSSGKIVEFFEITEETKDITVKLMNSQEDNYFGFKLDEFLIYKVEKPEVETFYPAQYQPENILNRVILNDGLGIKYDPNNGNTWGTFQHSAFMDFVADDYRIKFYVKLTDESVANSAELFKFDCYYNDGSAHYPAEIMITADDVKNSPKDENGYSIVTKDFTIEEERNLQLRNSTWGAKNNSYGFELAKFEIYIAGDCNSDGKADVTDLVRIYNYINNPATAINQKASDINGDGAVTSDDLNLLRKILLGFDN